MRDSFCLSCVCKSVWFINFVLQSRCEGLSQKVASNNFRCLEVFGFLATQIQQELKPVMKMAKSHYQKDSG